MATLVGSGAAAVWKITRGYLWRSQIFDLGESEGYQPESKCLRLKVGHEGFTQRFYMCSAPVVENACFW